jgi:hypothetical protein
MFYINNFIDSMFSVNDTKKDEKGKVKYCHVDMVCFITVRLCTVSFYLVYGISNNITPLGITGTSSSYPCIVNCPARYTPRRFLYIDVNI